MRSSFSCFAPQNPTLRSKRKASWRFPMTSSISPLAYSARHGWRIAGERARKPGISIRDQLLERVRAAGYDVDPNEPDDEEE